MAQSSKLTTGLFLSCRSRQPIPRSRLQGFFSHAGVAAPNPHILRTSPPPISTPPTGSPPTQPCPTPLRRLHHQKDASNRLQRPNDATKVPAAKAAAEGLPSPRQGCCQRATAKDTSDRPQPEQPVGVVIGVRVAAGATAVIARGTGVTAVELQRCWPVAVG
ncbi:uncharacterized protein PGTG_08167 [Puccinia graminis f. sp. tritici CRL 75-36-700-3]|uniref:Uncharacterized protein n=1 Tax=Puccinia graminis f. sp. tritici (strain CRL 75-36-700-3 / race SCCL) TaxID=418459 RepID=E3KCH0_PUCGT|nr:uncharacterized protein PGTG_08167 [Puccinia graminis f. sp. tritici CRL 75-36-700-3]EFP81918.1 hypothetical protein PGTG_08167 [Puccinia graminis f. sp. tritici CRL 75-36-700-3]